MLTCQEKAGIVREGVGEWVSKGFRKVSVPWCGTWDNLEVRRTWGEGRCNKEAEAAVVKSLDSNHGGGEEADTGGDIHSFGGDTLQGAQWTQGRGGDSNVNVCVYTGRGGRPCENS